MNTLSLATEGLDEDLAQMGTGDECYVRLRIKVESNEGGELRASVTEASYDAPCDESEDSEAEGSESEDDGGPAKEPMRRPDHAMRKRPGGIMIMLGGK